MSEQETYEGILVRGCYVGGKMQPAGKKLTLGAREFQDLRSYRALVPTKDRTPAEDARYAAFKQQRAAAPTPSAPGGAGPAVGA